MFSLYKKFFISLNTVFIPKTLSETLTNKESENIMKVQTLEKIKQESRGLAQR